MSAVVPAKAVLAVSPGDPAGIGPELVLRALALADGSRIALRVRSSVALLERVARTSGIPFPDVLCVSPEEAGAAPRDRHVVVDDPFAGAASIEPGRVSAECGTWAVRQVELAARDVLAGRAHALVTMPICKEAAKLAGCPFPGHTELLAHVARLESRPVMAFHSAAVARGGSRHGLFVALATIHEPLSAVPRLVTAERVFETATVAGRAFGAMFGERPRIGVLGLNPHAGENGAFGSEEREAIAPAIAAARAAGADIEGPLVPDAAFTFLGKNPALAVPPFDVYVAMYHDQALIPFKLVAFDSGVNVTLGLPFVRTSPDHGTAFDIAWRGAANPSSALAAVELAASGIMVK